MDTWLIVGLGNPGPRYAGNRHNVGAMVVAELASRSGSTLKAHKAKAAAASVRIGSGHDGGPGPRAILAVPSSFMNESGGAVSALARFFTVSPEHLIVVHDELDIPFGQIRVKRNGGEGGHNGLRSVSSALGTKEYTRVRVGIGRPTGRMDAADFVLHDFSAAERKELPFLVNDGADAAEMVLTEGLLATQQHYHAVR